MVRFVRLLSVLALGAATLLGLPSLGAADTGTKRCTGTLAPGTYGMVVVPANPACYSNRPVTITGGLYVRHGGTFVLGDEGHPGNNGTISDGVHATNARSVQIHFTRINGGIEVLGGSGPVGGPFGITWTTIEDSHVNGGVTIAGYDGFWLGFIRNTVNGTVTMRNNLLADPDGNEYVTNTIHGSFQCSGNSPKPQVGDSEGSLNHVTGAKTGQCAHL